MTTRWSRQARPPTGLAAVGHSEPAPVDTNDALGFQRTASASTIVRPVGGAHRRISQAATTLEEWTATYVWGGGW